MELSVITTTTDVAVLEAALIAPENASDATKVAAIQARIDALKSKKQVMPTFKRAASNDWCVAFASAKIKKVLYVGEPTIAQGAAAGREVRDAICSVVNEFGHEAKLRVAVWTNDEGAFSLPEVGQGITITKGGKASGGEFWISVARRESDSLDWSEDALAKLERKARAAVALRKIAGNSASKPAAQAADENLDD